MTKSRADSAFRTQNLRFKFQQFRFRMQISDFSRSELEILNLELQIQITEFTIRNSGWPGLGVRAGRCGAVQGGAAG